MIMNDVMMLANDALMSTTALFSENAALIGDAQDVKDAIKGTITGLKSGVNENANTLAAIGAGVVFGVLGAAGGYDMAKRNQNWGVFIGALTGFTAGVVGVFYGEAIAEAGIDAIKYVISDSSVMPSVQQDNIAANFDDNVKMAVAQNTAALEGPKLALPVNSLSL